MPVIRGKAALLVVLKAPERYVSKLLSLKKNKFCFKTKKKKYIYIQRSVSKLLSLKKISFVLKL